MTNPFYRSMDHESVIVAVSFGAGVAEFHHGAVVALQLLDHRGDDWTILIKPDDALRLAQSLLLSFGEIMEIPGPKPPTDEQVRRLMGEDT